MWCSLFQSIRCGSAAKGIRSVQSTRQVAIHVLSWFVIGHMGGTMSEVRKIPKHPRWVHG